MYLKEIDFNGFKSFADKLSITLNNNTTCIVGPNGSGKSNVVDAVRWVLGEQSVKNLRGDGSMTDVIFSGSKTRKSLNVASVSLIFDNSDHYLNIPYEEVSVKRRVYRTGENEYFLNGEKCRLKDILNLFIDSGIGRDSFNIISQGEVQRILATSPHDRRVVFEEAAEVLKYKKRKEEALRKLDKTHNNLDRVNDIITELDSQVEPLRIQSEKAKDYLANKEGLDKYEVALMAYDIENMNYEYKNEKEKIEKLKEEITSFSTSSNTYDVDLISLRQKQDELDKSISLKKQELVKATEEKEKLNTKKKLLKERSKYSDKNDMIHDNIMSLKEKIASLEKEIDVLSKELLLFKKDYEELLKEKRTQEEKIEDIAKKREYLLKEYNTKNKEKYDLHNKMESLNRYIENGANLSSSVKSILNNPKLNGIHDCIGNLVDCDEVYTKALEIALSSSRQFVVVDNEKAAKEAISYLKENNLGRATFFPLNVIKARGIDNDTLDVLATSDDYLGILSDLVSYDTKYNNIILNQLGNVIVVKDIDAANYISKQINYRYRVISLDGDIIHVGGSVSGGSVKVSRSVISMKQELERYSKESEELVGVISGIDDSFKELDANRIKEEQVLHDYLAKLVEEEGKLNQKTDAINAKQAHLEEISTEYSNLVNVSNNSISKEEEQLINDYYEAEKKKDEIEIEIKELEKEKEKTKTDIENLEADYKVSNSKLREYNQELKELEISVSKKDVKLDNLLNILNEEYSLTFEKAKENYKLDIEVEDARRKVNVYRNNIKRIGMVNLDAIEDYERVSTRYEFLVNQKQDLLNAENTLLEIIKEMDEVMKIEFKNTFEKVNEEFKKVFKELFSGGRAELKLTDESNILETGVEIIASPPGKKLTTISLLSGGEKTLTAISLLFAILNVRKVPFCLFDEVEAALDEANVDAFGHYLEHYKGTTQFLIITHKKKTMEYADTLYGITMQESGVSKLVSVALKEVSNKG